MAMAGSRLESGGDGRGSYDDGESAPEVRLQLHNNSCTCYQIHRTKMAVEAIPPRNKGKEGGDGKGRRKEGMERDYVFIFVQDCRFKVLCLTFTVAILVYKGSSVV